MYEDESVQESKRAEREARNAVVRNGFEHWEREAFARRLLKHDKEWVSNGGGYFQQEGSSLLDICAVEDTVVSIMSALGGKDELLDNVFAYHQEHVDANVDAKNHRSRLLSLAAIRKAKSADSGVQTFETEDADPAERDPEDQFANPLATKEAFDVGQEDQDKTAVEPTSTINVAEQDEEMAYRKPYLMTQLTAKLDEEGLALLREVLAHKDETIIRARNIGKTGLGKMLTRLGPGGGDGGGGDADCSPLPVDEQLDDEM